MNPRQQKELEAFKTEALNLFHALRKWEKSKANDPDLAAGLKMSFSLFLKERDNLKKRFPGESFHSLFRVMTRQFKVSSLTHQGREMSTKIKSHPEIFLTEKNQLDQLIADMKRLAKNPYRYTAKRMKRAGDELEKAANAAEKILIKKMDKERFERPNAAIKALNEELRKRKQFDVEFLKKVDRAIEQAQIKLAACKVEFGNWGEKLGQGFQQELTALRELRNLAFVALTEKRKEILESESETLITDSPEALRPGKF